MQLVLKIKIKGKDRRYHKDESLSHLMDRVVSKIASILLKQWAASSINMSRGYQISNTIKCPK
jgi:hypothetical protein